MIDVLDPNWIANILSISFTLVIFLLGIPVLFVQTYVPEELREYYVKSLIHKQQEKGFIFSIILLLLIIFIFGNHAVRYYISTIDEKGLTFSFFPYYFIKNRLIFLYYIISLSIFVFLSYKTYQIFRMVLLRKNNIKRIIIDDLFERINSCLIDNEGLLDNKVNIDFEKDILQNFNIYFKNGPDAIYFSETFLVLLRNLLKCRNYSGREISFFFDQMLIVRYIDNYNDRKNFEIDQVIDLGKILINKKINNYDENFMANEFIYHLTLLVIKSQQKYLIDQCLMILKSTVTLQDTFFKIYFYSFESKFFSLLTNEIMRIIKMLNTSGIQIDEEEKYAQKNNLIAYLSFFYNENFVMKDVARTHLSRINLTLDDLNNSQIEFEKISKFETANKIYLLKKDYFSIGNNP